MKIETIDIERVIPYARNPRKNAGAVDKVAASLREFGFRQPIVVDENYTVIVGHTRLIAAKKLGMKEVPVHIAEGLTDAQVKAYRIADNRTNEEAEWDIDLLKVEFKDLQHQGCDLSLTAFSEDELAKFLAEATEGLTDPDATPEVTENPKSKIGDIWLCGNHRVMCGDSTNPQDVSAVIGENTFDLCFTSPPYALGKSAALSGNKAISANGKAYDTYEDSSVTWPDLMDGWWSASIGRVSAWVVNVQPLAGNKRDLFRWIHDRIDNLVDVATWDKGHAQPAMAQGVMTSRFEWILVFGESNASRVIPFASWHGNVQNVYDAPPQRGNEFANVHGATMPIHFAEWVIGTLCDKSKTIFDPFGGTGTTLIACEKIGKTCATIEISPAYIDIIINRWQDFTGKEAVLESSGKKFNEIN